MNAYQTPLRRTALHVFSKFSLAFDWQCALHDIGCPVPNLCNTNDDNDDCPRYYYIRDYQVSYFLVWVAPCCFPGYLHGGYTKYIPGSQHSRLSRPFRLVTPLGFQANRIPNEGEACTSDAVIVQDTHSF